MQVAGVYFRNIPMAILLSAGANLTISLDGFRCLIHQEAVRGSVA